MASKGLQELRAFIQDLTGSGDTIEAEQVIDSILKKSFGNKMPKDKEEAITQVQEESGDGWEDLVVSTLNSAVSRYNNDAFPRIACKDCGDVPTDGQLDAISADVPEAISELPDSYIEALFYHKMQKPKSTQVHKGEEMELILASVLAAVTQGAGYLTVSYPPQIFLDRVLQIDGVTRESFYTTVKAAMNHTIPFMSMCMISANKHQEDFKEMQQEYQNLVSEMQSSAVEATPAIAETSDEEGVVEEAEYREVKEKPQKKSGGGFFGALKGIGSGLANMIGSVFGNREKHEQTLTKAADRWAKSTEKVTKKAGKKMIWLWRIITSINVVALIAKGVSVILTFFVDVTGRKTEEAQSWAAKIPLVGRFVKKTVKAVSASAIRSKLIASSIPWLIALTVLAVFSLRVLMRKEKGEQDNIFQMLISLIVVVATTISVILVVKFGFALFKAFQDSEYFWATFYDNFA